MNSELITIFLVGLATAIACGLGALPFIFTKKVPARINSWAHAIAAGFMIGASFGMIFQGFEYGSWSTLGGVILGVIVIYLSDIFLRRYEHVKFETTKGIDARKLLLIIGVMTAHSFTEGIALGAAYGPSVNFGILITLAIAIQNVPEGLAISLVMVGRGVSRRRAALRSTFSSLPQPLMAVPAFLFVTKFTPFLPWSLGFAGGAMIWMSISELLPESFENETPQVASIIITISIIAMLSIEILLS